jgi:hypothetical protein
VGSSPTSLTFTNLLLAKVYAVGLGMVAVGADNTLNNTYSFGRSVKFFGDLVGTQVDIVGAIVWMLSCLMSRIRTAVGTILAQRVPNECRRSWAGPRRTSAGTVVDRAYG